MVSASLTFATESKRQCTRRIWLNKKYPFSVLLLGLSFRYHVWPMIINKAVTSGRFYLQIRRFLSICSAADGIFPSCWIPEWISEEGTTSRDNSSLMPGSETLVSAGRSVSQCVNNGNVNIRSKLGWSVTRWTVVDINIQPGTAIQWRSPVMINKERIWPAIIKVSWCWIR